MNSSVCSSGHQDRFFRPSILSQGFLEFTLYGADIYLPLTSLKTSAVIGEDHLVTCHIAINCCSAVELLNKPLADISSYSSTNSRTTISAASPRRGPSLSTRV